MQTKLYKLIFQRDFECDKLTLVNFVRKFTILLIYFLIKRKYKNVRRSVCFLKDKYSE